MKTNTEILAQLKADLPKVAAHLEMISTGSCLQRCNTIFQIGGYTLATDANGRAAIEITLFPTQYEPSVAKRLTRLFKNCFGDYITPVAYSPKEWYANKVKEITESINLFEMIVQKHP